MLSGAIEKKKDMTEAEAELYHGTLQKIRDTAFEAEEMRAVLNKAIKFHKVDGGWTLVAWRSKAHKLQRWAIDWALV